jgi:hypothetical protein
VELFLNVTICPPRVAGFGENDRAPLLPVMVIVAGPVPPGDGDVGLPDPDPDPPPPPQLHAVKSVTVVAAANSRHFMLTAFRRDGFHNDEQAEYHRESA